MCIYLIDLTFDIKTVSANYSKRLVFAVIQRIIFDVSCRKTCNKNGISFVKRPNTCIF